MPRNGSGQFGPVQNSWNPAVNGAQALPDDWMDILNDISNGLTSSIAADGQTPITGVLNFQGNRISQVGAPTISGDVLRREQLEKGTDIASSAIISIPPEGSLFNVTGTTTITSFGASFPGRLVYLKFTGELTLTNTANLVLPTGENITTEAGDIALFIMEEPAIWRCISYPRYTSGGRLINLRIFTGSPTVYTPSPGTRYVVVETQGGGGGGGGAISAAAATSAGGGGGGGGYGKRVFFTGFSGVTITPGAGGVGVPGGNGTAGGASSFGALISAAGGGGGTVGPVRNSGAVGGIQGSGGVVSGAQIESPGSAGSPGITLAQISALSGAGGASMFGGSVSSRGANTSSAFPGNIGLGYGAGGGGALNVDAIPNQAGGNGSPGAVFISEYS